MKGIEYLDKTWNPVAMRCTPCSDGCLHCWHLAMCKRLAKNPKVSNQDRLGFSGGTFHLNQLKLEYPLHWYKPARIGVQFMGDFFHEDIPVNYLEDVLAIITLCPQHTFFILTKRAQRLNLMTKDRLRISRTDTWPIKNLWLGVTVCNQDEADTKILELLKVPGFKKWVSVEPMLGPVDLQMACFNGADSLSAMAGIDWVVAGAETGPGARPAHPDWFRSLRDQAVAAGVPFFLKKMSNGSRELDDQKWNQLP